MLMSPISPNALVSSVLMEIDLNGIAISGAEEQLRNKIREIKLWQKTGPQALFSEY